MDHDEERANSDVAGRVERLEEIISQYQKAAEEGRPLEPHQLLERHPDLAQDLLDFFTTMGVMEAWVNEGAVRPPGPTPGSLTLPSRVGRYEIQVELGRGGMGSVLRGRDTHLGRDIAVKVLLDKHLGKVEVARRFVAEARINSRLQHPGIAPVYELGTFPDRRPYFTMKLVRGKTLAELLADRASPSEELTRLVGIFGQVCQTVAYAHAQGVIHRDLKPANVMVGAFGEVQVMDWGLAKVLAEGSPADEGGANGDPGGSTLCTPRGEDTEREGGGGRTREGDALGTPEYMAPEQARGDLSAVDRRADVFGLGAILCEILTGQPPFPGERTGALSKARAADLGDAYARLERSGGDKELAGLARRCLGAESGARPRDAGEVAGGVTAFQDSVAERLRQAELARAAEAARAEEAKATAAQERKARDAALAQAATARRARRLTLGLASATALAAAALVALSGMAWQWAVREQEHAGNLGDALGRAEYRLAENYLDHGLVLCERGDVGPGLLWLARALEKVPPEADSLQKTIRTQLAGWGGRVNPLRECIDSPVPVTAAALSPDGRTVWAAGLDKRVRRWVVKGGKSVEPALSFDSPVHTIVWGPDGKAVLTVCNDGTAQFWDTGSAQPLGKPLDHKVRSAAWGGPAGNVLMTVGHDNRVRLLDPKSYALRKTLPSSAGKIQVAAVSPIGDVVLAGSADKAARLWFWDAVTGLPVGEPLTIQATAIALAFRPDGKAILVSLSDGHTQVWDAGSRKPIGRSVRHKGTILSAAFSPDGKTYLTGGSDRTTRLWDAATDESAAPPFVHQATVQTVAFGGDGRTILTAGSNGALRVWHVAPELPRGLVLRHGGNVESVQFSPDGRLAWTGSWDGMVRKWNAVTGELIGPPLIHQSPVRIVTLSPDGKTLLAVPWGKEVYLWKTATGDLLGRPLSHPARVSRAVFSPDGRKVLTGCNDGSIRIWDASTSVVLCGVPNAHPGGCWAVAFSPDGLLAGTAGSDGTARLWDTVTCQPRGPALLHQDDVWGVAFSRNGLLLTGGRNHRARLWKVNSGEQTGPDLWQGNEVKVVVLSPDGKTALTGSLDGTALLWETATGKPVGRPLSHGDRVSAVAFSPDGGTVLTGSWDGTARLWDAVTGKSISPPLAHPGRVWAVAFSPDGRSVLTGGNDNTARLWAVQGPANGVAEQITLRNEVLTGLRLDRNDVLRVSDAGTWRQSRSRLAGWEVPTP